MTVTMHIQTVDQLKAIKTIKGKLSDIGKMKVDAGDLRSFDTQQAGNVGQVSDLLDLLFEIGQRDDRDVGDDEQLVVAGHLDDRHVAQHALRGEQSGFLIEDAAHVFVGRDQSLHQHVGVACHDGGPVIMAKKKSAHLSRSGI